MDFLRERMYQQSLYATLPRVRLHIQAIPPKVGLHIQAIPPRVGWHIHAAPQTLERMSFFPSEDRVAWVFLGISLGLCPREIPRKTHATLPSDGKNITISSRTKAMSGASHGGVLNVILKNSIHQQANDLTHAELLNYHIM